MIPSSFVYLDKLPLSLNRKLDRNLLSTINPFENKKLNIIYPFSNTQLSLVKIWKKLLKIDYIGINHNFFEIGGNSILAIQMVSYIRKYFSKEISVADIFKNKNIGSLSLLLESSGESYNSPIICIKEGKGGHPLFMIHPGGGLAFCYMELARFLDMPIYGINNPNFTNPESGFSSIKKIAKHYIKLIKKVQKRGPYYLGGWSFGGIVALEMSQQLTLQNEVVKSLLLIDVANPNKISNKIDLDMHLNNEFYNEEDLLLNQTLGPKLVETINKNIKCCINKINNYRISKYDNEVFLIRAYNNSDFKTTDYEWKYFIKNLQVIHVPGTHSSLFDYEYIQSTAEAIRQAISTTLLRGLN